MGRRITSKIYELKTYVLLLLMVFFGSFGDVLLGNGMKQIGKVSDWSFSSLVEFFVHTVSCYTIWLGIGSLLIFFISYLLILSWADYSFVSPVLALIYVVVPVLGFALLGEMLSPVRWTGIVIIFFGVLFVSRTPHQTTKKD